MRNAGREWRGQDSNVYDWRRCGHQAAQAPDAPVTGRVHDLSCARADERERKQGGALQSHPVPVSGLSGGEEHNMRWTAAPQVGGRATLTVQCRPT